MWVRMELYLKELAHKIMGVVLSPKSPRGQQARDPGRASTVIQAWKLPVDRIPPCWVGGLSVFCFIDAHPHCGGQSPWLKVHQSKFNHLPNHPHGNITKTQNDNWPLIWALWPTRLAHKTNRHNYFPIWKVKLTKGRQYTQCSQGCVLFCFPINKSSVPIWTFSFHFRLHVN